MIPMRPEESLPATHEIHPTHSQADASTETNAAPGSPTISDSDFSTFPELPARYRVVGEIARGGMGSVWHAIDSAFQREVAIKTLLPGADAGRFLTEARITAQLSHPGIPPVHDLGTLADGSPFLAMKRIRGHTLSEALRSRQTTAENLPQFVQIFEQICQAVGFAHSRGIIHRDLKPQNVMVGAFGEVQVMDWGLAKQGVGDAEASEEVSTISEASEPASAAETLARTRDRTDPDRTCFYPEEEHTEDRTRIGTVMGTPAYMAPEQARGDVTGVDRRTDVFALGAILCELLTGKPPLQGNSREIILAAARGDLLKAMTRLEACTSDLELITLAKRCLSPTMNDRPLDAQQVANEVAAYRAGVETRLRLAETERARAETMAVEQLRRRRVVQWSGGIIAAALLIGMSVSLWQRNRAVAAENAASLDRDEKDYQRRMAEEQRRVADDQRRIAEEQKGYAVTREEQAKKAQAQSELDKAVAVSVRGFLQDQLLRPADPWQQGSEGSGKQVAKHDLTVRALLDQASEEFSPEKIPQKFPGQRIVQAEILETIGETYLGLGEFPRAIKFAQASTKLREEELGPMHPQTLARFVDVIIFNVSAGQHGQGLKVLFELFARFEELLKRPYSPDSGEVDLVAEALTAILERLEYRVDPRRVTLPSIKLGVGQTALLGVQIGLLVPRVQKVHKLCLERYGDRSKNTLLTHTLIGFAKHTIGQTQAACDIYEKVLDVGQTALRPGHPLTLGLKEILATTYSELGIKFDESQKITKELYETWTQQLGPEHPRTIASALKVAHDYIENHRLHEALPLLEKTYNICKDKLGPDHPQTLDTMNNLGAAYLKIGRYQEAASLLEEALAFCKSKHGNDHQVTIDSMDNLAWVYFKLNRSEEALASLQEILKKQRSILGRGHAYTLTAMNNLALGYQAAGHLDEAIQLMEETLRLGKSSRGIAHLYTIGDMINMSTFYREAGRTDEAIVLLKETDALIREKLGMQHPETQRCMNELAISYQMAGQIEIALPLLEELHQWKTAHFGPEDPRTLISLNNLAMAYEDSQQLQKSTSLLELLANGCVKHRFQNTDSGEMMLNVIDAYEKKQNFERADHWRKLWLQQ